MITRFQLSLNRINLYQRSLDLLWAAALITLPFTSFPPLMRLTGAVVAPLTAIPVLLLILLWFAPYVLKHGSIPQESRLLLIFFMVALLASALAFFLNIPGYKGRSILGQELRTLFTLMIGLVFYLTFSSWPKSETLLNKTCRLLTIGGIIALGWSMFQALFIILAADEYPIWFIKFQRLFVSQSPFFDRVTTRVAGLTYEASWLSHQLIILYIPLWLAATYKRISGFKFRILRLSLENILLFLGLGVFLLTSPRISMISIFLMGMFIFLKINLNLLWRSVNAISHRRWFLGSQHQPTMRVLMTLLTSILMLSLYIFILVAVIYFASRRDWRLELLVTDPPTWLEVKAFLTLQESVLLSMAHRLVFLERMVYWFTGLHVFNDHPWLGVGLGNAGFFTQQQAPAIGWASFEVRSLMFRLDYLPNIKSLWVRLLAETGLVGFSVFVSWLVTIYRSARLTLNSKQPALNMIAFTGQLSLIAFIGEGFSIDSFAMPYIWVTAGLIAAAGWTCRKHLAEKE